MKKFLIGIVIGVLVALSLPALAASPNDSADSYCGPQYSCGC